MKEVLINTLDDLEVVDGCYRLEPDTTYRWANNIVASEKPIEDKTPYYRKLERKRKL